MAEHAEPKERSDQQEGSGIRRAVSDIRDDMSVEKLDAKLSEAAEDRPLVPHLLDMRVVVRAVLIAAVTALLVLIVLSAKLAGVVLVIAFFAAWVLLAMRSYEKRRATRPAEEADEAG